VKDYIVLITIIGLAIFTMAWMPRITKKTGISYAIFYLLAGMILYTLMPSHLPDPLPQQNEKLTLHLSEIIVIISLMGAGIKIDQPFSIKTWLAPLRLVLACMVLSIALAACLGYKMLGFDLASAILLAAALAPTDPVLASDVQVGPPNEKVRSTSKFTLTAEAGLNDGMAFPFIWLAIFLAGEVAGKGQHIIEWVSWDVVYRIVAGIGIGWLMGKLIGFLVFRLAPKLSFLHTRDGLLAIAATFLVYGITELAFGYGFIAVFVCAITLRQSEKGHEYHQELHSFSDQLERLLIAVFLILLGGSIVCGILSNLTWSMAAFTGIFLVIIRPGAGYLSLWNISMPSHEKLAISFLGIRGIGSIFYLAFAVSEINFSNENELWSMVVFTIVCSIILHGFTANKIMNYLHRRGNGDL